MVIHLEDIKIVNMYLPNIRVLKYINQILTDINEVIDNNTLIQREFNTPLSTIINHPEKSRKH